MENNYSRTKRARILIVDDAVLQLHLITASLQKAGFYNIETAEDGAAALEKTRKLNPDLVILDLSMPKLDGFGYCEAVRGDKKIPHMPIIVQTALDDRASKLQALSCGADDFLHKPLDPIELALRAGIHLERYFTLRDLHEMCGYLRMELAEAHNMRHYMKQADDPKDALHLLDRHYETLAAVTVVSGFGDGRR